MADESDMTSSYAARIPLPDENWSSLTVLSDQRMLSTLGGNLRSVYEELTDADQPSDLLRLAAMIDERRGHSRS